MVRRAIGLSVVNVQHKTLKINDLSHATIKIQQKSRL